MQELFAKVVDHIPTFLSNLIELLTKPKAFLVQRARQDTVADALVFLSMAAVLSVILGSPMIGVANLVPMTILLIVAGTVVFAVSAFVLILSWKLVGGDAGAREHMVILAYLTAPLVLLMVVVFLLGWPNVAGAGPEDLPVAGARWVARSMQIIGIVAFAWTIAVWGAFRTVNRVSKGRSVAAFVASYLLSIPANILGTQIGWTLGWFS